MLHQREIINVLKGSGELILHYEATMSNIVELRLCPCVRWRLWPQRTEGVREECKCKRGEANCFDPATHWLLWFNVKTFWLQIEEHPPEAFFAQTSLLWEEESEKNTFFQFYFSGFFWQTCPNCDTTKPLKSKTAILGPFLDLSSYQRLQMCKKMCCAIGPSICSKGNKNSGRCLEQASCLTNHL